MNNTFVLKISLGATETPLVVARMLEEQVAIIREYYADCGWLPVAHDNNNPLTNAMGVKVGEWKVVYGEVK